VRRVPICCDEVAAWVEVQQSLSSVCPLLCAAQASDVTSVVRCRHALDSAAIALMRSIAAHSV